MLKYFIMTVVFIFTGCTNTSLTPISNAKASNYHGKATILIAVDGTDNRKVRHIELSTKEEPEGFEIYFHDKKYSQGFIVVTLPTPSTQVRLKEYSLTGMYGCSRGKAGYGYGTKVLPKIENTKTYFLGTINTSMNTMYKEMPNKLIKEAKEKYNYLPYGSDIEEQQKFKSNINL